MIQRKGVMIPMKGTLHEGKGSPHGGKCVMIPRKGHHMEGMVTTWREWCNDSKEGSPHGGSGYHMEGSV